MKGFMGKLLEKKKKLKEGEMIQLCFYEKKILWEEKLSNPLFMGV